MQSSQQNLEQGPSIGNRPKSRRRAFIAAVPALALVIWASSTGLASGLGAKLAQASPRETPTLSELLEGSAVTFSERAKPLVEAFATASADEQRRGLTKFLEILASENPERSTRTAVLLGALLANDTVPNATRGAIQEALTIKLARRLDMGERWKVSADVVVARALDIGYGSREERAAVRNELIELAHGADPHPHLAVRVECAASVLKLPDSGQESGALPPQGAATETTNFLLAVLRAETPDQVKSPRTWPRMTTLAWVKTTAAEALAHWTGTDNRFRPDGSWAHQVAEAARFEALLR